MRVYEEYATAAEKRAAQRGAKRGIATGKARGYLLVFPEDGREYDGSYSSALGELLDIGQGPGAGPEQLTSVTPSLDYLRSRCRSVGFQTLPRVWREAFRLKLASMLGVYDGDELAEYKRRYRRVLRPLMGRALRR